MRNFILGAAIAALLSTSAMAGKEVATSQLPTMKPLDLSISLETDSYYNTETENMTSETGVVLGYESFTLGITPTITDASNEWDVSDIKLDLAYEWKITDDIAITPYGELHYDSDLEAGDKVIGLKTSIKLY